MNDPVFGCLVAMAIFALGVIVVSAAIGMDLGGVP